MGAACIMAMLIWNQYVKSVIHWVAGIAGCWPLLPSWYRASSEQDRSVMGIRWKETVSARIQVNQLSRSTRSGLVLLSNTPYALSTGS